MSIELSDSDFGIDPVIVDTHWNNQDIVFVWITLLNTFAVKLADLLVLVRRHESIEIRVPEVQIDRQIQCAHIFL